MGSASALQSYSPVSSKTDLQQTVPRRKLPDQLRLVAGVGYYCGNLLICVFFQFNTFIVRIDFEKKHSLFRLFNYAIQLGKGCISIVSLLQLLWRRWCCCLHLGLVLLVLLCRVCIKGRRGCWLGQIVSWLLLLRWLLLNGITSKHKWAENIQFVFDKITESTYEG